MEFSNPDYQKLVDRLLKTDIDITILPTPVCPGSCSFCDLDRCKVGDRQWGELYEATATYLSTLDFTQQRVNLIVEGGELFADCLITPIYEEKLLGLFALIMGLIPPTSYIGIAISPENISEIGIQLVKKLTQLYPRLGVNVEFAVYRVGTPAREEKFWTNLRLLRSDNLAIGTLITSKYFLEGDYLVKLARYTKKPLALAEMNQFADDLVFSYQDMDVLAKYNFNNQDSLPYLRRNRPGLIHNEVYITSSGVCTGFHIRKRSKYISSSEWQKLQTDPEYRIFGYQQVLDWYRCTDCSKLLTCQGMLWTSYYVQKEIFNNRKCLYRRVAVDESV